MENKVSFRKQRLSEVYFPHTSFWKKKRNQTNLKIYLAQKKQKSNKRKNTIILKNGDTEPGFQGKQVPKRQLSKSLQSS